MTSLLESALEYVERGWSVIPMRPRDKRPLIAWKRYQQERADAEQVTAWWKQWPDANVGIVTGAISALVVLDSDGEEGQAQIDIRLPFTTLSASTGVGNHYYFAHPGGTVRNFARKLPGLDFRGDGGYVVAPPSIHPSGVIYTWQTDIPDVLPDAPDWLTDLLTDDTTAAMPDLPDVQTAHEHPYVEAAMTSELAKLMRATEGQRNDRLNKSAFALGQFVGGRHLDRDFVERELTRVGRQIGLSSAEVRSTVQSGLGAGMKEPRIIPAVYTNGQAHGPEPAKSFTALATDWRKQGVTLAELQHHIFLPERWIVEGIFPEGACLLAAKYKSKKSWIALALSLAVSMNNKALGRLEVSPGRVLYLDLEGKQQRIQKRTRAMLGVYATKWPDNFHIFTKWPQGDAGMQELEQWFQTYPDTIMVVIDVLASFRRPILKHEEIYRYDRDTIDPLNEMFERHHAGGFLVHHFNKGKHDDIMDSITGSTGIPSAVNTMWGLTRDPNDSQITILHLRGRDLENDDPLALRWDSYLNQHIIEGPAAEVSISAERKAILNLMSDDKPRTPKEIAAEIGRPVTAVQFLLRKLLNDGVVDKVSYGTYARIPTQSAQTPQSAQSAQSAHSERDHTNSEGVGIDPSEFAGQRKAVNANSEHSEHDSNGTPIDAIPANLRMTTRMMLVSPIARNQEQARERCEEYGVDYEAAKKWADRG